MSRTVKVGAARAPRNFGIFADFETDWLFKSSLEYMAVKGAEIGECLYVARRIDEKDSESWMSEWASLAERVENQAQVSLAGNHRVSARESFLRATTYYRLAEHGALPTDPRFDAYWHRSVMCFQQACALFDAPIQILEVQFEGRPLAAYFWQPAYLDGTKPTMIAAGGNDSSIEELVMGVGTASVARGYNFFTFDHPGHRGAIHRYRDCIKRSDYELPYKAALNLLVTLPGVDERIALSGFSFGGFTCSRVACFEERIKALIPDSPIIDSYRIAASFWMTLVGKIPERFYFKAVDFALRQKPILKAYKAYTDTTNGTLGKSLKERIELAQTQFFLSKEDLARIECPTLVLVSKDEGEEFVRQAEEFYDSISSLNKSMHIFSLDVDGSNDHCQLDNFSRASQVIFDWLDDVFGYYAARG